jgi:hypothetical protein
MCTDAISAVYGSNRDGERKLLDLGNDRTRNPRNGLTARKLALPHAILNRPTTRKSVDLSKITKTR